MSVRVSCPNCTKELNAPDELIGQLVACPRCSNRFHVKIQAGTAPAAGGASVQVIPPNGPMARAVERHANSPSKNMLPPSSPAVSSSRAADLPPPPASGGPESSTANLERISLGSLPTPTAQPPDPPAAESARETPQPASQKSVAPSVAPSDSASIAGMPTGAAPKAAAPQSGGHSAQFKTATTAPSAVPPSAAPARKRREVRQAKFVASGAVATRINLGEDGQLPELVVADSTNGDESKDAAESSTSPMLMLGVLIFSVVVSVVMLMLPDGAKQRESTSKHDAVARIENHYIGLNEDQSPNQKLKPYQRLLRDGLQARRRGDQEAARSAFRRVLEMLRAESTGNRGVTTEYKWAEFPPNDGDLEELLNVLLADE